VLFLVASPLGQDDQHNMSQELVAFMESIREQENAGGNYLLKHRPTTIIGYDGNPVKVQALGAYGILDINWDKWAEQAGYEGADWRVPEMQDIVAAYKFTEYYNKYGSWDLVAVAWYAGPARANKAKNMGLDSIGDIENIEGFGPNVQEYVNSVIGKYEDNLESASNTTVESYVSQSQQQNDMLYRGELKGSNTPLPQVGNNTNPMEKYAADLLSALVPRRNLDFESQVPEEVADMEEAKIKTDIQREESIGMQDLLNAIDAK